MPLEKQEDLQATLAISPQEAERGTIRMLSLPEKRQVRITVPANARHGQILRLEGLGLTTHEGGPRSALRLTIAIVKEGATQQPQSTSSSPDLRGYLPPSSPIPYYSRHTSPPAIPHYWIEHSQSYDNNQQSAPARKRRLTAALFLITALLAFSASIWLLYNNYARPAAALQTAAQSIHLALPTIQKQINNPYVMGTSKLLMNDPLSKPSTIWQVETHDNLGGACVFTDNTYHAEQSQKGYFRICSAQSIDVSDFVFEVHMQIISGYCGGILFRQLKAGQYYLYRVCSDGDYSLTRFTDNTGKNSFSLSYAHSSSIYQGNKENVIAIVAQGPRIRLYINNTDIGDFSDGNYLHGMLGLIAEYKDVPVEVTYSQAHLWSLVV
jgi:hypothetical protein